MESFWASISYLLAVAVTQPIYATLSDVLGRKPCLYAAYAFFFAFSIVFALAKSMGGVIAGRILQGFGGGGLDVLSEIIVTDMTTLRECSLYLGLMAIPPALGSVLGPTIAGIVSSLVFWRWLGWINLPMSGSRLSSWSDKATSEEGHHSNTHARPLLNSLSMIGLGDTDCVLEYGLPTTIVVGTGRQKWTLFS